MMKLPHLMTGALAAMSIALALPVPAAETGDAAAGAEKKSMCAGCHGIPGYHTVYPEVYKVPKLGGQHPAYIVKALTAYKSGERDFATMRAICPFIRATSAAACGPWPVTRPSWRICW